MSLCPSRSALAVAACALWGCSGTAELQMPGGSAPVTLDPTAEVSVSGLRRLSRVELDATLADLLGDTTNAGQRLLPPDSTDPFDNDFRAQLASGALIESIEKVATEAAVRALADPARRATLVPCTAVGPDDAGCLRTVISTFGRRALRRPLTDDEVNRFASLQSLAVEAGDFDLGVKLVVQALLQHPEFIYRVELGTPVDGRDGVFRLSPWELASRLSYFFWGSTPPDWLLDAAGAGQLDSTEGIRLAAAKLLADPKAKARVERFHALWLGYHRLPHPVDLTAALQTESGALVDRVVFDEPGDYFDLFTSSESYLNSTLATHYGVSGFTGAGFAWTPYGDLPRKGLLSHGAVLSAGAKFSDTSPTQRGIFVRTRLLCQDVPPPPPTVNADIAPTAPNSSPCKADRYSAHASTGNCFACHQNLDPIGFGLERFDREGRYRTTDDNLPQCPIAGAGRVVLDGAAMPFSGPVGLADTLIASGRFEGCVVTQLYRFAMGRREAALDSGLIEKLTEQFKTNHRGFTDLMLDLVTDGTFSFRKDE